jgi:hypothetical protein
MGSEPGIFFYIFLSSPYICTAEPLKTAPGYLKWVELRDDVILLYRVRLGTQNII